MEYLIQIGIVIGIGMMIGLEREYSGQKSDEIFAGVRTFPLVALLGYLSSVISYNNFHLFLLVAFLGVISIVTVSYFALTQRNDIGATTEISLIVTFVLGVLIHEGKVQEAITSAVVVTALLSLKVKFKTLMNTFTRQDFLDLVKFVVITLVILPILPDKPFDPSGVLNPREIWYVIVLISGLSFFGYIMTKFTGREKGILLTSFVGGFVSSTLITWDFAEKSKTDKESTNLYAAGILIASTIMYGRIWVLIFILNPELAMALLLPLFMLLLTGTIMSFIIAKSGLKSESTSNLTFSNPLNLKNAVLFAVFFAVLQLLIHYAKDTIGNVGIYAISFISGIVNIDPITLSIAKFDFSQSSTTIPATALILSTISNNLFKISLGFYKGNRELTRKLLLGFGVTILVTVVVLFFV